MGLFSAVLDLFYSFYEPAPAHSKLTAFIIIRTFFPVGQSCLLLHLGAIIKNQVTDLGGRTERTNIHLQIIVHTLDKRRKAQEEKHEKESKTAIILGIAKFTLSHCSGAN